MDVKWQLKANAVEAKLAKLQLGGAERGRALDALGNALANRIRLGFRIGQSPYGAAWKPINPAFRSGQPLRDTGRLQRSIKHAVQGDSVLVGTNVRYAATHQFGAQIKPKNAARLAIPMKGGGLIMSKGVTIPARPFMPMTAGGQVQLPPAWAKSALNALAKSMGL
jgi:phage virion morphogenesis protein